jgi:hypothetical protein
VSDVTLALARQRLRQRLRFCHAARVFAALFAVAATALGIASRRFARSAREATRRVAYQSVAGRARRQRTSVTRPAPLLALILDRCGILDDIARIAAGYALRDD